MVHGSMIYGSFTEMPLNNRRQLSKVVNVTMMSVKFVVKFVVFLFCSLLFLKNQFARCPRIIGM